jgi:hypothetical protein
MRRIYLWFSAFALVASAGCASTEPLGLRYGPHQKVDEQRRDAQMIDPYPLPSAGPDITGARPRDFDVPRSEPRRTQDNNSRGDRWSLFGN